MAPFQCLPFFAKSYLFTTLEDSCYCCAIVCSFGLLNFTVGPLSTFTDICFEEESGWQATTRYYANFMKILAFVLFIVSFIFIWGVKKRKPKIIVIFMYVTNVNTIALLIFAVLLLSSNIISTENVCDYPNVKYSSVVFYTSVKMLVSILFAAVYFFVLMVAKSYYLTLVQPTIVMPDLKIVDQTPSPPSPPSTEGSKKKTKEKK